METQPNLPNPADAPKTSPSKESGGFFARWRKKVDQQPSADPEQTPPPRKKKKSAEGTPATPEASTPNTKRSFGKNVLNFLFGDPNAPDNKNVPNVATSPNVEPDIDTPEETPDYQRASRMRRFARAVIANVLGVASAEPNIAANTHTQPVNVDPLTSAANNLQTAANTLNSTINFAQQAPNSVSLAPASPNAAPQTAPNTAPNTVAAMYSGSPDGGYDSLSPDIMPAPVAIADRLDDRLRRLEASAETNRTAAIAATGLGVLAVLLVGVEYLGRKRADRGIKRETKQQFAVQEKKIEKQQAEFNQLRQEHVADMNRNQRRDYYERLSTFTNEQAAQTREVAQDLNQVTEQYVERVTAAPVAAPERREPDQQERRTWQPRQPESVRSSKEQEPNPTPLVRVENAEQTERGPSASNNMGSAGTGFFGGGGASTSRGGQSGQQTPTVAQLDPNSREARQLEALRKAQQKKLQSNAWLYSAALILALVGMVVISIFVG